MAKEPNEWYTQCRFEREEEITVGWIPSWAAKKGNRVQLLDIGEGFWKITDVYSKKPKEFILEHERDFKNVQGSLKGGGIDEKKAE